MPVIARYLQYTHGQKNRHGTHQQTALRFRQTNDTKTEAKHGNKKGTGTEQEKGTRGPTHSPEPSPAKTKAHTRRGTFSATVVGNCTAVYCPNECQKEGYHAWEKVEGVEMRVRA
jgi:hypothetical protein